MEIPSVLKDLYRHWDRHIGLPQAQPVPDVNQDVFNDILAFVHERIEIWKRKTAGAPAPWTADPVLAAYRFCNIFREFDKQTIAFHKLLNPLRDDFALWLLNMFYCRMVARPETIEHTGLLTFDDASFLQRLATTPRPRFGTAYVFPVSTIQRSATPTREKFIAEYLPMIMPTMAKEIATWTNVSVYDGVSRLLPLFGFNHAFLWTEVLIDVAYQYPDRVDLFGQFPIGPGSLPTMKRISARADPSVLVRDLSTIPVDLDLTINGKPVRLSAENWEGIGCEFRKYSNLINGRGRKRRFTASPPSPIQGTP